MHDVGSCARRAKPSGVGWRRPGSCGRGSLMGACDVIVHSPPPHPHPRPPPAHPTESSGRAAAGSFHCVWAASRIGVRDARRNGGACTAGMLDKRERAVENAYFLSLVESSGEQVRQLLSSFNLLGASMMGWQRRHAWSSNKSWGAWSRGSARVLQDQQWSKGLPFRLRAPLSEARFCPYSSV